MNLEHIFTIICMIGISVAAGGYMIYSLLSEEIRNIRRQIVEDMIFLYDRAIKEIKG